VLLEEPVESTKKNFRSRVQPYLYASLPSRFRYDVR